MSAPVTPQRVLQLKRDAKPLAKAEGIKQTAALERIARREGFATWHVVMKQVGGRDVVDDLKHNKNAARLERKAERLRRPGGGA